MATFLRANYGHRVKAVVRRRGHRTITRTFDTRKEAEFWAIDVEKQMARGTYADLGPAVRLPLRRVIELYSRRYTGRKRGWRQETNRVKAWQKDPLTERPIAKIRARDVVRWIQEQEARGSAPSTIKNALQIVSQAYRFAATELGFDGLVNPIRGVRMPAAREGRNRRLEPGELDRLTEACAALGYIQLRSTVEFAVATAMRRGEILALTWKDIRKNSVLVRRSKTGRQRAVALSPAARHALDRLRPKQRNVDSGQQTDPALVFPEFAGPSGDRLLERQWYKVLPAASVEELHFHDLRHEGISRLFEVGLTLPEVMQMSGHTTPTMLMRYTHLHVDPIAAKLAAA
jgi:integrase